MTAMKLQVSHWNCNLLEHTDAYTNLSKSHLAQQSKIFNEKKLKEFECQDILNKITFLLNQVRVNTF